MSILVFIFITVTSSHPTYTNLSKMQFKTVIVALTAATVVSAANDSNASNTTNAAAPVAGNSNLVGVAAAAAVGLALLF